MRKLFLTFQSCLLLCALALSPWQSVYPCHLSHLTLVHVEPSGDYPVIFVELCIGGGRTGPNNGADGDTFDFAFGFYNNTGLPLTVISFVPSVKSEYTQCEMLGYDVGPVPFPPFYTDATIHYPMDIYSDPDCATGPGFSCITSAALCGPANSECYRFNFALSEIPNSIRVFGVEGGGNPVAGCYTHPDMHLDLTSYQQRITPTPEPAPTLAWNSITPNPTSGTTTLSFISPQAQPLQLQIYNSQGQSVQELTLQATVGPNELNLDLTALPAALYWLRLSSSHTTTAYKILKQ